MMEELFQEWVNADNAVYAVKEQIAKLEQDLCKASTSASEAMVKVRDLMMNDGLIEETIKGALVDYKIYFTSPRQSVKVLDDAAVPDDFCKIERKPELKKIKEYIDANNIPNWAAVEVGQPKLTYKAIVRK